VISRSFAGSKARYAHEEFLETIDVSELKSGNQDGVLEEDEEEALLE